MRFFHSLAFVSRYGARVLGLAAIFSAPGLARADSTAPWARIGSERGSCLVNDDGQWRILEQRQDVPIDKPVLGLPGAFIEANDGGLRLTFRSDLSGTGPLPIIETVISLQEPEGNNFRMTLDRGRIDLSSNRELNLTIHVHEFRTDLKLSANSRVALQLYGRWPAGARFVKNAPSTSAPAWQLILIVLQGSAEAHARGDTDALKAPSGPALIEWNNSGQPADPQFLRELPAWARDDVASPMVQKKQAVLNRFRETMVEKSIGAAIDQFLQSDDPAERRLAVYAMGALDNLAGLGQALAQARHEDIWDNGVIALRHWIGRCAGQDQKLYRALIERKQFSEIDAETVLQLLHSFAPEQLEQPETLEVLVDFLKNDRLAIRGLAHWHLVRLIPEGKDIHYNPLDAKEKRDAAAAKWRELISKRRATSTPSGRGNGS
jgi:hypothetical protein